MVEDWAEKERSRGVVGGLSESKLRGCLHGDSWTVKCSEGKHECYSTTCSRHRHGVGHVIKVEMLFYN